MPVDKNRYFPGKFKNCGRCRHREYCLQKGPRVAFTCKKYMCDYPLVLRQIEFNRMDRIQKLN